MYYVYRYMLGRKWLYVGKANASNTPNELQNRINDHARDERFKQYENYKISFCVLSNASDMNAVESMLIKIKHPLINVKDRTTVALPFKYDSSKITWIPIDDFDEQKKKNKTVVQDIVDENLFEFVRKMYINGEHKYHVDRDYYLNNYCESQLSKSLTITLFNYIESNKEFGYPGCVCEFDIDCDALLFELKYPKKIQPQTLNRLLRESIKRVFDKRRVEDWWSVIVKRNGTSFHFRAYYNHYLFRDIYTKLWTSFNVNIPQSFIDRGA